MVKAENLKVVSKYGTINQITITHREIDLYMHNHKSVYRYS